MSPKFVVKIAMMAGLIFGSAVSAHSRAEAATIPDGFISLFDGETLEGWRGDPTIWSVREGAITGNAPGHVDRNTFLILDTPLGSPDYEIHFKYRFLSEGGNSGIQFRSGEVAGNHMVVGFQANAVPLGGNPASFAMLIDEVNRMQLAMTGERVTVERTNVPDSSSARLIRTVHEIVNPAEDIQNAAKPRGEWNDAVLIVYGNRYVYAMNGLLAFDVTDEDPLAPRDGLIALQYHRGAPSSIQFKDIAIQPLTSMPDISRFSSNPTAAPAPARTYRDVTLSPAEAMPD